MVVPIGLIFSLPVLVVYYILFYLLTKRQIKALTIKITLCIVCIAGILIKFYEIKGELAFFMSMIYSASVVFPTFLFRVYERATELESAEDNLQEIKSNF